MHCIQENAISIKLLKFAKSCIITVAKALKFDSQLSCLNKAKCAIETLDYMLGGR